MGVRYAEVIGDPIAHSKSPLIHKFWLDKVGIAGDYRATPVPAGRIGQYLSAKRADPWWRGCNVTAPLKREAAAAVGAPAGLCDFVGAVNCVSRTSLGCLLGTNTDLNGIEEALAGIDLGDAHVTIIGAGGAARALLCYLTRREVRRISLLVRNPRASTELESWLPGKVMIEAIERPVIGTVVINASPMGMAGHAPMAPNLLAAIAVARPAVAFDMVYAPVATEFLATARSAGARTIDGLSMLIGQAAPAFEYFFGAAAPRGHDAALRKLLTA